METVPVFYIRKAWYGILLYFYEQLKKGSGALNGCKPADFEVSKDREKILSLIHSQERFLYAGPYKVDTFIQVRYRKAAGIFAIHKRCLELVDELANEELKQLKKNAFGKRKPSGQRDGVLIESSFQANIHSPLSNENGNSLRGISTNQALFFYKLWGALINPNKPDSPEIEYFIEQIKKHSSNSKENIKQGNNEIPSHPVRFPKKFMGKYFSCYERSDPPSGTSASWGISVGVIYIGDTLLKDGSAEMHFETRYLQEKIESIGFISYDPTTDYLIGRVKRKPSEDVSLQESQLLFVMRVFDAPYQTMLIGYHSYYGIRLAKYVTKTVVWILEEDKPISKDTLNTSVHFDTIDISIRRFLYDRNRNRLTLPRSAGNTLESLESWLDKKVSGIVDDLEMLACTGKYFVCYYYGDLADEKFKEKIRIDELDISYDENAVGFECVYVHNIKLNGKSNRPNVYKGKASKKNGTVQIHVANYGVSDPASRPIPNQENHILVSFRLRDFDPRSEDPFANTSYFEGVISGLSDVDYNPLCLRIAVVKKRFDADANLTNPLKFDDPELNASSEAVLEYLFANRHNAMILVRKSSMS